MTKSNDPSVKGNDPRPAINSQHEVWATDPYVVVMFDGQHLGLNAKNDAEAIRMTIKGYHGFPLDLWRVTPRARIYSQ